MTFFQTIILSAIEGITEFLPISSTGHLILAEHFLKIVPTDFIKSFDIIIQLGAILAVVWLYSKKILNSKNTLWKVIVSFLPTGIIGVVFYKIIKTYLLGNVIVTALSLFLGGIILLILDSYFKNKQSTKNLLSLNNKNLISIGLFQSISMVPGVSRSAASIVGGLLNGLSRKDAVEFSFLLAIPTMMAASGYDILKSNLNFSSQEIMQLLIGFVTSFLTATIAVKAFTSYVQKNDFKYFAYYRIILALIVLITLL